MDQAAVIRHLTRLLSALALKQPGGELRVSQGTLDQLKAESPARALFEDFDSKTNQVVLRFRAKSLATYLVEEQACQPSQSQQTTQTNSSASPPPSAPNSSRPPLTDRELASLERQVQRAKIARQFRAQTQPASSNPLDEILSS